jgi:hypothetical protein
MTAKFEPNPSKNVCGASFVCDMVFQCNLHWLLTVSNLENRALVCTRAHFSSNRVFEKIWRNVTHRPPKSCYNPEDSVLKTFLKACWKNTSTF